MKTIHVAAPRPPPPLFPSYLLPEKQDVMDSTSEMSKRDTAAAAATLVHQQTAPSLVHRTMQTHRTHTLITTRTTASSITSVVVVVVAKIPPLVDMLIM